MNGGVVDQTSQNLKTRAALLSILSNTTLVLVKLVVGILIFSAAFYIIWEAVHKLMAGVCRAYCYQVKPVSHS